VPCGMGDSTIQHQRNVGVEENEMSDCLSEWKASMEGQIELVRLSCGYICYSNLTKQCARNNLHHRKFPEMKRGGRARSGRGEVVLCEMGDSTIQHERNTEAEENEMSDCLSE
jgi:hypothetical protein